MADDTGGTATPTAAGSSPAPTASTPEPAVSAAPATSAPAPIASPAPDPKTVSGEPPKERWDDILTHARTKTRAEVEAEFKQKYGKYDTFEQDPWKAVQDWLEQAKGHSLYGPLVTAHAARLLQAQRGKTPAAEEPQPDVPIVDAQGNATGQTYSATRLKEWQNWNWQQQQAGINERLQPLEAMRQAQETAQQQQALEAQALESSGKTLETLRQDPIFKEHEATIKQALIEHPEFGANVHQAYVYVLTTKVLPGVTKTEQTKVLESLQTQAAGSTVHPGTTATAPPKFKSPREALIYYDTHPEEAAAMAHSR